MTTLTFPPDRDYTSLAYTRSLNYTTVEGVRLHVPRLVKHLERTARWALYARRRQLTAWDETVMPLVRAIHDRGGLAFIDDVTNGLDVWRVRIGVHEEAGRIVFGRETISLDKPGAEPLENVARNAWADGIRGTNVDLGQALTAAYTRVSHGDIAQRANITMRMVQWGMRELINRRFEGVPRHAQPEIVRVRFEVGEWVWRRAGNGYTWEIIISPMMDCATVEVP